MNCGEALARSRKILEDNCIDDSSLEGEILLRHVLGMDRAVLFATLDLELSANQSQSLMQLVERRRRGEPSSYITGRREFYGINFKVDRRVLIPRPETELLVEKAVNLSRENNMLEIADIGTGCGCIAVSLAKNIPAAVVYAVDISPEALEVAAENCAAYKVQDRVHLLQGDLLEPVAQSVDMIIANLPYVKTAEITSKFEPELALNGGPEGLDKIQALCRQVSGKLKKKGVLLLEVGQGQAGVVKNILKHTCPPAVIEITRDLAGIERVVSMRLTS